MHVDEITNFLNLPVYTQGGTFVGSVRNVVLDVSKRTIHGLVLHKTNPDRVDRSMDVTVPYRWVRSADDIVVLSYFPQHVEVKGEDAETAEVTA